MIDDKEIDIAARAQALSKHVNETAYFQLRSIEDFKDGAKWALEQFLKDLWHPASKEPAKDKPFLAKERGKWLVDVNSSLFPNNVWSTHCEIQNITRWLYIDDLVQKKGGKE